MSASSQAAVTPERIQQLAWGYAPPLIIEAGFTTVFSICLDGGSKTVEEVATRSALRCAGCARS